MTENTIGARIRSLRKSVGLNQTEFGRRIGLKQTAIGLYENGVRNVSKQSIALIASTFHVREDWLLTGEGERDALALNDILENPTLDDDDRTIIESYASMDVADRTAVKKFIVKLAGKLKTK